MTVPQAIEADLARAARLEYWTIGWMVSIIAVMGLAMGSSQAMRTSWIEDVMSLVAAIVFLVALRFERKAPDRRFPFGYHRAHSLAFLISAVALTAVGATLVLEAAKTLVKQEHVTIEPVLLFGQDVWLGWLMIGALAYSVIPPVILGRLKQPLARRLSDKVLHTDAMMQKADWQTGLAGIAGVIGIGLGYWWADAAAAGLIAFSILKDGIGALKTATAELVDGTPRAIDSDAVSDEALALEAALRDRYPGCEIRLRETGRYIRAQIEGPAPADHVAPRDVWPGPPERAWRLDQLSFAQPEKRS